jgi:hypothetical protein
VLKNSHQAFVLENPLYGVALFMPYGYYASCGAYLAGATI